MCPCGRQNYCNYGLCRDCYLSSIEESAKQESQITIATDLQTHLMLQNLETRMQHKTRRSVIRRVVGRGR